MGIWEETFHHFTHSFSQTWRGAWHKKVSRRRTKGDDDVDDNDGDDVDDVDDNVDDVDDNDSDYDDDGDDDVDDNDSDDVDDAYRRMRVNY